MKKNRPKFLLSWTLDQRRGLEVKRACRRMIHTLETNEGAWGWGCGREGALVLVYRVTRIGLTVSGNQKFHGEGRVM